MKLLRISDFYAEDPASKNADVPPDFAGTLDEARAIVRATEPGLRGAVLVEQFDYPTDKAGALEFLKGRRPCTLRAWRGTRRGGLLEIPKEAGHG